MFLLICGCVSGQADSISLGNAGYLSLVLVLMQAFGSSLGGIYFQWLMQTDQDGASNFS